MFIYLYSLQAKLCYTFIRRLSFQNTHIPGCGRTIVPSWSVSTGSYCDLLMCIPLFPARKTVLYYYPKLEFSKFTMPKFWENSKIFSPNAQSLRLWKSSLTQNWIRITIFEKLIISFWKCTYATSCSYVLCHLFGIWTVGIPVTKDDICSRGQLDCTWLFPIMTFPY